MCEFAFRTVVRDNAIDSRVRWRGKGRWWVAVGKTSEERLKSIRDGGFLIVREKSELGKCGMRMWWLRNVF